MHITKGVFLLQTHLNLRVQGRQFRNGWVSEQFSARPANCVYVDFP
jgi:hypothetical protein